MSELIEWTFDNGVFLYEQDLESAKRDRNKIEGLLRKYPNLEDAEKIYQEIQKEDYRFESDAGMKFDDFIYEEHKKYEQTEKKHSERKFGKLELVFLHDFDKNMQSEIIKVMKQKERYRLIIAAVCACLCITCFGYFGIYQRVEAMNLKEYEELALLKEESAKNLAPIKKEIKVHLLSQETVTKTLLPDYALLYEKNPDLVGWIKIDDTLIDYPVVQTSNNEFYLEHSFSKESDGNGCIFLDMNCNIVEESDNLILYGHHMRTGNMFGNLNKYANIDYYYEHPYITFDSIYEKGRYQVMYVFQTKVFNEDEITFKYYQFVDAVSRQEFDSAMNSMAKMSLYDTGVTAEYGDKLLTLSTCDYQENKGRFVVVAKKMK